MLEGKSCKQFLLPKNDQSNNLNHSGLILISTQEEITTYFSGKCNSHYNNKQGKENLTLYLVWTNRTEQQAAKEVISEI